jgi:drug/metabolite transporter (DMT)-like permease
MIADDPDHVPRPMAGDHHLVLVEADSFDARTALLLERLGGGLRETGVPLLLLLRDPSPDDEVRALNLGADDILPWQADRAVLRARLSRLLAAAWGPHRHERADIDRLVEAARRISAGRYHPGDLGLGNVGSDRAAAVATVFAQLAATVHERQKRRDAALRTIRGIFLVIAAGAVFGLAPAIGRISALHGLPPLGVVFWANVVAAAGCLGLAVLSGGVPRLTRADLRFLLAWAVVLGCLYQSATAIVAAHVEASTISLVASTRGFLVFLLAALLALEAPSLRRFAGLGAGFIAVAVVLSTQGWTENGTSLAWLLAALSLPALLAVHTLLMAWRSTTVGVTAAVGIMMAFSAVMLLPVTAARGEFLVPWHTGPAAIWIILALAASTACGLVLGLRLVTDAGPVFAGQMAYSQALAGILWGVVLIGETVPPLVWGAIAVVIAGFWLVTPRPDTEQFRASLRMPATRAESTSVTGDLCGMSDIGSGTDTALTSSTCCGGGAISAAGSVSGSDKNPPFRGVGASTRLGHRPLAGRPVENMRS